MLLDSQAMHHDEGIHALFGWNIYQGQGYAHDAVYHGPFIYHSGALAYLIFGDTDVTARLMPALFSVATVMLPMLLRRQLGRWGALVSSFLLLISPSFLYFGRFVRNDVFGAFWTLLLFICIVRYLAERRNGWLYGVAATTSLYFSTKETAYITVATLALFLLFRLLWERYRLHAFWPILGFFPAAIEDAWKILAQDAFPVSQVAFGPVSLSRFSLGFVLLALVAVAGMLAWRWVEALRRRDATPTLDLVILLGTMVLPLLSAIPLNALLRMYDMTLDYHSPNIPAEVVVMATIAIALCFAVSAGIGLPWDSRRWATAAGIFWGIFFLLHTSFFSSMTGWATGLVQALGFWLSQQGVKRIHIGPQYYLVIMPVYETVSLLFGTVGAVFFAWRGLVHPASRRSQLEEPQEPSLPGPPLGANPGLATAMLSWWAPVGFAVYSLAGEQVPWLNVHPTLPFLLLTGALIGRMLSYRPRGRQGSTDGRKQLRYQIADWALFFLAGILLLWAGRSLYANARNLVAWLISVVLLLGAIVLAFYTLRPERRGQLGFLTMGVVSIGMTMIGAGVLSFQETYTGWRELYVPLALVTIALVLRAVLLGKPALRTGALLFFGFLCAYSLSSAWRLAYINNDTPVEMLVYVQTSSDVQKVFDEMETLSVLTTGKEDMAFLYDSEVSWPMEWYFRNYSSKVYQATIAGPPAENIATAMVYRDVDNTSGPYLERRFVPTRYYSFNWWFPEDIIRTAPGFVRHVAPDILEEGEQADWQDVFRSLGAPSGQARVWRYAIFREVPAAIGAREFAFYVRQDLVFPLEWLKDSIPRR
jgi:predicted membrane-bound mannosyltransferase